MLMLKKIIKKLIALSRRFVTPIYRRLNEWCNEDGNSTSNLDSCVFVQAKPTVSEPILIMAMSKSASSYINSALLSVLDIQRMGQIAGGAEPQFLLNERLVKAAVEGRMLANQHADASPYNRILINHYYNKMIVHMRDPRQALLSYFYNIERNQNEDKILNDVLILPVNYFNWSMEVKLDYLIDNRLPLTIDWIRSWIDAEKSPEFKTTILFTTYEEFVLNNYDFFIKIFDFYDLQHSQFNVQLLPTPSSDHLFRRGNISEWITVYTDEQKQRIRDLIDPIIFKRFNWIID
jgi:hypothetical protein